MFKYILLIFGFLFVAFKIYQWIQRQYRKIQAMQDMLFSKKNKVKKVGNLEIKFPYTKQSQPHQKNQNTQEYTDFEEL